MTLQLRPFARHAFVEAWPLWLMLGGFAIAAVVFRAAGPTWASAALEIGGLGTVAWGLHRLRTNFGRPGVIEAVRDWLRRFPALFAKPRTIELEGHMTLTPRVSGTATLTMRPRAGATIDERVTRLEQELEGFRESHARDLIAVRERVDGLAGNVARERDDRARDHAELKRAVEEIAVGGLTL